MIQRKPLEKIQTESARKVIQAQHEQFGRTIAISSCFGSSDIGQMTGFIVRQLVKEIPNAFMRCPLALWPEVEGPTQVLLYDDFQVVIDGCKDRCLKKTFEQSGIKVDLSYALDEDFNLEKGFGPDFHEQRMREIAEQIRRNVENLVRTYFRGSDSKE